jgi:hypothetical protein
LTSRLSIGPKRRGAPGLESSGTAGGRPGRRHRGRYAAGGDG